MPSCYPITRLRYADNRIVNIMKVYIERTNLQLELIRFSKQMLNLFTFTFLRSDGFANETHSRKFRTQTTSAPWVTDLGRFAAASECMAGHTKWKTYCTCTIITYSNCRGSFLDIFKKIGLRENIQYYQYRTYQMNSRL